MPFQLTSAPECHDGFVPMFSFSQSPSQEVVLPDGRRWTVRIERGNEPRFRDGSFDLTFWNLRWMWARLTFALTPPRDKRWRVVIVPEAVESRAELNAMSVRLMGVTPSIGEPVWLERWPSEAEAAARADQVFDEVRRTGQLPGPSNGVWTA